MAEFTIRVNPAEADAENPLGEVIEIQDNFHPWPDATRRSHAIVRVPKLTIEEVRDVYHAHLNTPDDDPIAHEITLVEIDEIPSDVRAKVAAYLDRVTQEQETFDSVARPALASKIEEARKIQLDAAERVLSVNDLLALATGKPWVQRARKAYRLAYRAAHDAEVAELPVAPVFQIGKAKLRARTVTVPYPVA